MTVAPCYIGTSGWNYKHWSNGRFYPPGLRPANWLPFLAERFNTVEVNYSFYRVPTPQALAGWQNRTPLTFLLAFKLWRGITHYRKLQNAGQLLAQYLEALNTLSAARRGPLLVQLPPQMTLNLERLDAFLSELPAHTQRSPWRIAVEFRHPSWLIDRTRRLLNRRRVALALADMGKCPITEPNDVDFVYVRRHGGWNHPQGRYLPGEIAQDAQRIRGWLDRGKAVFVYYNNDLHGHAVDNAAELMAAVGVPPPGPHFAGSLFDSSPAR